MKVLLIDNGTTLLTKLERLIPGHEIVRSWKDFTPEQCADADLVILSGGSKFQLTGNEGEFERELTLIRKTKKPLVGICFGCELIAVAWGGTLKEMKKKHKGIRKIAVLQPEFFGGKTELSVFENHRWIIDAIPEGFEILAKSEQGPEMIKNKTLPIYGLQFHPENFVDQTEDDDVFLQFLSSVTQWQLNSSDSHNPPA